MQTTYASHVIIGDGITALAFAERWDFAPGDGLVIIGRSASEFGRGAAYAKGEAGTPWRYAYLLNSPADDIDPEFARWLDLHWAEVEDTMQGRAPNWLSWAKPLVEAGDLVGVNAPREFYGDFMAAKAEALFQRIRQGGGTVTLFNDIALSVEARDGSTHIETAGGEHVVAATVDIAPGGPSTMRFDGDDGPFAVPSVFGHEHRIAEHIRAGAEIFCIGGNAAMLDVLRLCQSIVAEDALKFVACAPDGELTEPLIPRLPRVLTVPNLTQGHKTAESFLAEVWREIELAKRGGHAMREIRAGFRAHFLDTPIRHYLNDPVEARRVPARLRFWLRGGTRDTILDMRRLVTSGRTQMLAASATSIEHTPTGAVVHMKDPAGGELTRKTGFVVNCAGAGRNSRFDPVTEGLLAQGAIARCAVSGGIEVGTGCATTLPGVRYLSPATAVIGDDVMAMPLYDAHMLRTQIASIRTVPLENRKLG